MSWRSAVVLVVGLAWWALAFCVSWLIRDVPGANLIGAIMGGTAGLAVGRALCFPKMDTWF